MAELKTKKTEASVEDFLSTVTDEGTRKDCFEIVKIMKQATKADPKMWLCLIKRNLLVRFYIIINTKKWLPCKYEAATFLAKLFD